MNWRVISDKPASGAYNMAVDQAIMEAVGQRMSPPTLRLYAWEPPCLSLGYNQPSADADLEQLQVRGWHLVRRATGGKAILHTDELTYSIALPDTDRLVVGGIVPSYRRLSAALLRMLELAEASVESVKKKDCCHEEGPVCFEVPSDYEITANGKKLVGSAQVRRQGAVLQHGSLPLTGDITRIVDALAFPDDTAREVARKRVALRATTLDAATGTRTTWQNTATLLTNAVGDVFGLPGITFGHLSAFEQQRADELTQTYASDEWTFRR